MYVCMYVGMYVYSPPPPGRDAGACGVPAGAPRCCRTVCTPNLPTTIAPY